MKNFNFNFDLSVSTQAFENKNAINWGKVEYTQNTISLEYMPKLVTEGFNFCHVFNTKHNSFKVAEKTNKNFKSANMVFVDVDDSQISMFDFLAKQSKHPSICYNTANNGKNGLYRYRLGYLLENPIYDLQTYENAYFGIIENIKKDIPSFIINDNCGKSATQQFAGNASGNANCMIFHNIFTFDEIFPNRNCITSSFFYTNPDGKKTDNQKTEKTKENTNPNNEKTNKEDTKNPKHYFEETFYKDYWQMSYSDLITKYQEKYNYFDKSDIEFNNEGFAVLGDDYKEIKRTFSVKKTYNEDGTINFNTKRIKDGEMRHRKIYLSAMTMKAILPTISATHLLYNLVCETHYFIDNSDGKFNKKYLEGLAIQVYNTPIEEIKMQKGTTKKFVVSKSYCRKNHISATSRANEVRKILNFQKIGEIYDVSLSVKDNLQIFKDLGIKTSKNSLYRWCKENNISTKGEKA